MLICGVTPNFLMIIFGSVIEVEYCTFFVSLTEKNTKIKLLILGLISEQKKATHPTITCSKLTIETLEKGVK